MRNVASTAVETSIKISGEPAARTGANPAANRRLAPADFIVILSTAKDLAFAHDADSASHDPFGAEA